MVVILFEDLYTLANIEEIFHTLTYFKSAGKTISC